MLAASVEHRARAQPARQQAARGKSPPEQSFLRPQGLDPAWEGLVAISVGLLCFLTHCACPREGPQQCCPWTPRSCLEVARAWSSCGEDSRSHRALQLQNPGDLPRVYCSRAEDHTAQGGFPLP